MDNRANTPSNGVWSVGIVGEDIGKPSGAQYEEFTYPR
jgi:hypothetical protein